jgi:hypothetical protein
MPSSPNGRERRLAVSICEELKLEIWVACWGFMVVFVGVVLVVVVLPAKLN